MKKKKNLMWAVMVGTTVFGLTSCGVDMPQETQSSFETMTVKKSDIELPYKFSARMKGQNDVTVTPQVSGQLMKICVTEGQQVKKGQTLFVIEEYFPGVSVSKFESIASTDHDDDKIDTWVEYVIGTDPTNIMSRLEAYIRMDGGKPVVESNIDTNRLDGFGYRLVTKGKPSLDTETDWSEADDSEHKFFMLSVEPK